LIHYVLRTAESTGLIDDVIVSSDSEELLEYSASLATMTRLRPAELAGDDVTLDPVIYDAVKYAEEQCGMPCGAKS
jgi:CMP-N-acetylneuraminic acid synthetase